MKILIIRFSSIGDIVLTTPIIRCVKQQLNAEVHFLCKSAFAGILESNPYIDRIHHFPKKLAEVIPALKAVGFDYIIDLHHNLRSRKVRAYLRVPTRAFPKFNLEKWLLVNWGVNRLPKDHIVDRYFKAVISLNVENDGEGLDFFGAPDSTEIRHIITLPDRYIAFAIGAAHATKRLPNDKIIAICQKINKPIILLGGSGDAENGKTIAQATGPHVQNACGSLSIPDSAAVIRDSHLVISHDTGMMHIAAAFKKKIISIWGNTVPAFGMHPYYGNHVNQNTTVEVSGLSCRPCSKIGHKKCPKGHFRCMNEIDVDKVVQEVLNGLESYSKN